MGSVHITQLKEEYQQMGHIKEMTDMVLHTFSIYAIHTLSIYAITYNNDLENLPEVKQNMA